jgi:hypothetical protein
LLQFLFRGCNENSLLSFFCFLLVLIFVDALRLISGSSHSGAILCYNAFADFQEQVYCQCLSSGEAVIVDIGRTVFIVPWHLKNVKLMWHLVSQELEGIDLFQVVNADIVAKNVLRQHLDIRYVVC